MGVCCQKGINTQDIEDDTKVVVVNIADFYDKKTTQRLKLKQSKVYTLNN